MVNFKELLLTRLALFRISYVTQAEGVLFSILLYCLLVALLKVEVGDTVAPFVVGVVRA